VVQDCGYSVRGTVVAEDGIPQESVVVSLVLEGTVWSGVNPVRRDSEVTDTAGHFEFLYLRGCSESPLRYRLRLQKEGYETLELVGLPGTDLIHTLRKSGGSRR
jgi:hypothetical protein